MHDLGCVDRRRNNHHGQSNLLFRPGWCWSLGSFQTVSWNLASGLHGRHCFVVPHLSL